MLVTEKNFLVRQISSLLYDLDADTVAAIYSVIRNIHQKRNGGSDNGNIRKKERDYQVN